MHLKAGWLELIGFHHGSSASLSPNDLNHFAHMVDEAPPGALDPTSSNYLFHSQSAAAKGTTTERQDESMQQQHPEGEYHRADQPIPPQDTEGEFRSPPPQG